MVGGGGLDVGSHRSRGERESGEKRVTGKLVEGWWVRPMDN